MTDLSAPVPAWRAQMGELLSMGSTPHRGGLGRQERFRAAIEALPLSDRRLLLEALDEVMRPMTARELDQALMVAELSRGDRKRLVGALKGFPLVMVGRRAD